MFLTKLYSQPLNSQSSLAVCYKRFLSGRTKLAALASGLPPQHSIQAAYIAPVVVAVFIENNQRQGDHFRITQALQRRPPPGSSSQGSPGGRHGATSCSEQLCQMSKLLRGVSCIPHQVCKPRFYPTFHAQLSVSRTAGRGLGLDSGCLFSVSPCSA